MKILTHTYKVKASRPWVYVNTPLKSEQDPLDNIVAFPVERTLDRAPLENKALDQQNLAEVTSITSSRAVAEAVADGNEIWKLNASLRPPEALGQIVGLSNLVKLRPDLAGKSPEAYFWKNLLPWRAIRLWLDTSKAPWSMVAKVGPQMLEMLESSPQFYTRNDSALMNQTAMPTVETLKRRSNNPKNCSLLAIDFWENSVLTMLDGLENEHLEFEESLLPQFESEETWKRWIRYGLGYQQGRVRWLNNQQKTQIAAARAEIKNNILGLRKAREDHLQPVQANLRAYVKTADLQLRQSAQNKIEAFAADILQDPEAFINNPQAEYRGINWRETFGQRPLDLLEALNIEFGDRVIRRAAESPKLEHDMNATIHNIEVRVELAQENFANTPFQAVKQKLSNMGIEPAPEAQTGEEGNKQPRNLTTREIVRALQNALQQVHENIDLATEVYNENPIRLTPEEKLSLLIKYLEQNPNALESMEEVSLGNTSDRSATRLLSRYILEQDALTQTPRSLGSLDEGPTDANRYFVTTMSQSIMNTASQIFNTNINEAEPDQSGFFALIQQAIRNPEGQQFETCRQMLLDFVANFDAFVESIGYDFAAEKQNPKSLFAQLPEQDRFIASNILKLKRFRDDLTETSYALPQIGSTDNSEAAPQQATGLINFLNDTRRRFYNEVLENLPPNIGDVDAYAEEKNRLNRALDGIQNRMEADIAAGTVDQHTAMRAAQADLAGNGGLGFNLRSDMQTPADTLEDLIRNYRDRLEVWDRALRAQQSFALPLPANPGQFYETLFQRVRQPLAQLSDELQEGGAEIPSMPSLDQRMHKKFAASMTDRAEKQFAQQYIENARQQWALRKSMNIGDEISTLQFGDLTYNDGIFNLSSGVTKRISYGPLQLYRKDSDRLLFESFGEDGVIIALTAPKDLSKEFSHEQMEAEDFNGHANCLVYNKSELQRSADDLFMVPQTNYNKAGIMLNAGSALAGNYKRPDANTKQAHKRWHGGFSNIAA